MPGQFANDQCIFCAEPSSPTGEHVLDTWALKMFPQKVDEYSLYKSDEPVLDRDGVPRQDDTVARAKLPMCVEHNGILNTRFGQPAKPIIRKLLDSGGEVVLDAAEAEIAARWYVKTWLLLGHPRVVWTQPGWDVPPWEPVPADLYSWMVSGQQPPPGLSAWAFKHAGRKAPDDQVRRLPLLTMVIDTETVKFQVMCFGLGAVEVHLAYHPRWEIDHPLEREHRAIRLWPRPSPHEDDFAALPVIERGEVRWWEGFMFVFPPGTSPNGLPPLSETSEALNRARARGAKRIIQASP
jgi:hypothetical protein